MRFEEQRRRTHRANSKEERESRCAAQHVLRQSSKESPWSCALPVSRSAHDPIYKTYPHTSWCYTIRIWTQSSGQHHHPWQLPSYDRISPDKREMESYSLTSLQHNLGKRIYKTNITHFFAILKAQSTQVHAESEAFCVIIMQSVVLLVKDKDRELPNTC